MLASLENENQVVLGMILLMSFVDYENITNVMCVGVIVISLIHVP